MMYSTYFKLKTGFNSQIDRVVNRAEVILEQSYSIKNQALRQRVRWIAKSFCHYGDLLTEFPRLDVFRLEGEHGTAVHVGQDGGAKKAVASELFPNGYQETNMGRVAMWKLPAQIKSWLNDVDVVTCNVSRKFLWRINAPYMFDSPLRVQQILPLDKPLEEHLAGGDKKGLRKHISRMKKMNYTSMFSHSLQDFEFFYHCMYVPTAVKRFGNRAEVMPYELLQGWMKREGGVVLVSLDGQAVGGALIYLRNGTWFDGVSGLLDGNYDLMKHELGTALYWYSIQHAIEHRAQKINFMATAAWQSSEYFYTKQKWGTKVVEDPWMYKKLILLANHLSAEWRDHLNNIGFLTCVKDKHLRVYIDKLDQFSPDEIEAKTGAALTSGLNGIQVVGRGYRQTYLG